MIIKIVTLFISSPLLVNLVSLFEIHSNMIFTIFIHTFMGPFSFAKLYMYKYLLIRNAAFLQIPI